MRISVQDDEFGEADALDRPTRRRGVRAQIAGSATLSWTGPNGDFYTQPAMVRDRSEVGYSFELGASPAVGQRVRVDLLPARRYWGTVRHCTWAGGAYRVGVELDPQPAEFD